MVTRSTSISLPTVFNELRNDPWLVGFDQLFDRLVSSSVGTAQHASYPPYNLVKENDNTFFIELALAGFKENEINVTVTDDTLTVESILYTPSWEDSSTYLHQGIARRSFSRSWTLSPPLEVSGAEFKNGLLVIELNNVLPEENKPRVIPINGNESGDAELLNE